jgi:membrane dipeptidase
LSATPDIPVIDGHNDTLLALEMAARAGHPWSFAQGRAEGDLDLPRARAGGLAAGFFACFVPREIDDGTPLHDRIVRNEDGWAVPYEGPINATYARDITDRLVQRLSSLEAEGSVRIARSVADLETSLDDRVIGAILHLEGAEAIGPDLGALPILHMLGLRSIGIVWSRPNAYGEGVPFCYPSSPDTGGGLTEAGHRLVHACNDLGIMVDLAHLNERGFWDVAEISGAPLVSSHTAAHALTPTARNLTDAQIDAIGDSGGLVGVILNVPDLRDDGGDDPGMPLKRWVAHVDHIAARIGRDHVALGSDFDGASMPTAAPDAAAIPGLLAALRDAGWSEEDLRAFAHRNWLRVLRATWKA